MAGKPFNKFRGRGGGGSWRGKRNHFGGRAGNGKDGVKLVTEADGTREADRAENGREWDALDESLGWPKYTEGPPKEGWLVNMTQTLVLEEGTSTGRSGVDYYFIQDDGDMFKATMCYEPYFFIAVRKGQEGTVEEWIMRKYEDLVTSVKRMRKEDLDLPNHLLGYRREYIQLNFRNQNDLFSVRRDLLPIATKNKEKLDAIDTYAEVIAGEAKLSMSYDIEDVGTSYSMAGSGVGPSSNASDAILDIREYDVPYYLRVAIDKDIRVGLWYTVTADAGEITMSCIKERVARAEPVVMAFDIETTKAPLKFPDQATDQVMMISYMIDGQGFLITNREIVSADIEDFEYTPKAEFEGPFTVLNEADEAATIRRFFEHIRDAKPTVIATYNGDSFDFPFLKARATVHGIDMYKETGFAPDSDDEFKSRGCAHMDCFRWVKRDSYLPQGSQGLKAVTVAKLGYNPIELDPELMTPYAVDQPQVLAQYSVSDAVATYYLYMKYVHPFIFSLCNIIPLNPDEVLRKGSGTLCETLLMVEAYRAEVIMPNRHVESTSNMFEGHLLESETYVGGHVEALEAGVFRSDIETDFRITPSAVQQLIDDLDRALQFSIVTEGKHSLDDIDNYDEVRSEILTMLEDLRDNPMRSDKPLIYHLDVAAMYPNIMLSNRLQPDSVVSEADCAACDYNRPGKQCQRKMKWAWRGEYFPAKLDEFKMVRNALESETFPPKWPSQPPRRFVDLSPSEQTTLLHKRLGDYSRKVYKKTKETKIEMKESIICQRENPFYIDTVRTFRDRRYTYKGLHKDWKRNLDTANAGGNLSDIVNAKNMIVLYDSLQLAHKCILNSFYGYVMRKGARWHSMEMAGITCLTGASIIQMARKLVEQIGRPLELDTDGIWCMLPGTFPDNFTFKLKSGKKYGISYPCTMLNHLVHKDFTNDQYHELVDAERGKYEVRSENSIFFELDGPYRAMILPSSKEEDKLLKKRYAVFNDDGSLAELKGFEVKRRGELQLIKIFQSQIFEKFLLGDTLKDCYASVATVANKWLDILFTKAATLPDDELVDLIAENRSMSRTLAEYAGQKSTSISTAKRLAEFLGEQMVKDKGLACKFIISAKPLGAPVTERAIPVAIFSADPAVKKHFLRKWLKDPGLSDFELRSVLDWDYYIERLGSVVQKLITIPAALQKVSNPVPRIRHPDWLFKRVADLGDKFKQHRLEDMFAKQPQVVREEVERDSDDEDTQAKTAEPAKVEPPPKPAPDITQNYSAWIAHMKPIWREKRKAMLAAGRSSAFGKSGTLGSMLFNRSSMLSSSVWDIVQIVPVAERPGEFKMWLLIRDSLQSVRLRIPRQFLVNFAGLTSHKLRWPSSSSVEPISRTLPRGQAAFDLVRVTTSEEDFLRQAAVYNEIINGPDVDGVYEMQIPLVVRALLALGTTCVPDSIRGVSLNTGLDSGFELADLKKAGTSLTKRSYLEKGRSMRYIYLFHANSDYRHVYGLFLPDGNLKVYVVERGRAREVRNLESYYAEQALKQKNERRQVEKSKRHELEGVFKYTDEIEADVLYPTSDEAALRAIGRELSKVAADRSAPAMLAIHSPKPFAHFEDRLPASSAFPVIMIHSDPSENVFPALLWQAPACKRMIQHYLRASLWIKERIELAEKFDVPVCNVEQDVPVFLADLEFARRLHKADLVLWWSASQLPDLGGREADANSHLLADDLVSPEVGKPGCYSNASIEVDLRNLAVDAVLQSALVYELEGGEGGASIGFEASSHNLDDYAKGAAQAAVSLGDAVLPTYTFNVLRLMLKSWSAEAAKSNGVHWRLMLDHFWRWVSSPAARMYDPAMHRFIHGLMRKTFSQLLAEFKRLGSEIVHGDFGRLILLTSRPTSTTAYAYAHYIVSSITSRELFKYLELSIVRFWDQLAWMDTANYAGIICSNPESEVEPTQVEIDMHWNAGTFLPDAVREDFDGVIGRFIHGMYLAKRGSGDAIRTPLRVVQAGSGTATAPEKLNEVELSRNFVQHSLTRTMLKTVSQLKDQFNGRGQRRDFAFPVLPGSHLKLKSPLLEFVKTTCAIFALARHVSAEVVVLKRNMLDLIGIKEFAAESQFRNPCLPYKVPMVVCKNCNHARDLDLTRDVDLLVKDRPWACSRCHAPYNRQSIEALMIDSMIRRVVSWQLQDLRCARCKQIKSVNLRTYCECSGEYQTSERKVEVVRRLEVTRSVAEYHELGVCLDVAESLLRQVGPL